MEYTCRAQFNLQTGGTVSDKLFPQKYKDVSLYRGGRELLVYRP